MRVGLAEVVWDPLEAILAAAFSAAPRHLRRLAKVASLESEELTP
jgi:hypothetical protein